MAGLTDFLTLGFKKTEARTKSARGQYRDLMFKLVDGPLSKSDEAKLHAVIDELKISQERVLADSTAAVAIVSQRLLATQHAEAQAGYQKAQAKYVAACERRQTVTAELNAAVNLASLEADSAMDLQARCARAGYEINQLVATAPNLASDDNPAPSANSLAPIL